MSVSKTTEKKWKIIEGNHANAGWGRQKAVAWADTKTEAIKWGKSHYDKFTIGSIRVWHEDGETGYTDTVYYYSQYGKKWNVYEYLR